MISFHLIHKLIPVPVFWTDRFLKEWQGGASFGIFCVIRPKYKDKDRGILEHELTHCEQFYSLVGLHSLLYLISSDYRLIAEVEAYRKQLEYCENKEASIEWMADAIATKYNLTVAIDWVKSLLRR